MRNVITIASIIFVLATPSLQAAETFDGLWAKTQNASTKKAQTAGRSSAWAMLSAASRLHSLINMKIIAGSSGGHLPERE